MIVLRGNEHAAAVRHRGIDDRHFEVGLPQLFAGRRVESEYATEAGTHEHLACVERRAAAESLRRIDRHVGSQQAEEGEVVWTLRCEALVPQRFAVASVERKNMSLRIEHED